MSAPSVISAIDGVVLGTPRAQPDDSDMAEESDEARQARMKKAYRAYRGKLKKPLKKQAKQPDLNIRTNRIRPAVRAAVAFLVGGDVQFTVATDDPQPLPAEPETGIDADPTAQVEPKANQAAQQWLDDCMTANVKAQLLDKLVTNGCIYGHAFLKIIPDGRVYDGESYPRLVNLDPQRVDPMLDPDDCDNILGFAIRLDNCMRDGHVMACRQLFRRTDDETALGAPETWEIVNQVCKGNPNDPAAWKDDGPPLPWQYSWSPIKQNQHLPEPNRFWGAPLVEEDLIDLQHALNFAQSNRHSILYHHGHPEEVYTGVRTSDTISSGPGEATVFESPDAKAYLVEMQNSLEAVQVEIDDLRTDQDELTSIPSAAVGRMKDLPRGDLPGITLRTLYQPAINMTTVCQETYGEMLIQLCKHLLEIGGFGTDLKVTIAWPQILPTNLKEWAVVAPVLDQMGVSKQSLVNATGEFDWDQEQARKALEDEQDAADALANAQLFNAGGVVQNPMMGGQATPAPSGEATGAMSPGLNHPAMQQARANAIAGAQ